MSAAIWFVVLEYVVSYVARLLVAVIEKLLPANYYSVNLAGVQADQVRMPRPLTTPTTTMFVHV